MESPKAKHQMTHTKGQDGVKVINKQVRLIATLNLPIMRIF